MTLTYILNGNSENLIFKSYVISIVDEGSDIQLGKIYKVHWV